MGGATCVFDATTGSATIPSAVFQAMPEIDGVSVTPVSRTIVQAGEYQVELSLSQDIGAFRLITLQ